VVEPLAALSGGASATAATHSRRYGRSRETNTTLGLSHERLRGMILEHAVLQVAGDLGREFEKAFREASGIISSMRGFRSLRLERCMEDQCRYLLLVEWERLEDHTQGFRQPAEYHSWKDLVHHFYGPFPEVKHYESVLTR
jgi:heme-degrading monooxygenase HmoA